MTEFNFNIAKTCCFTGHRDLPTHLYEAIKEETKQKVQALIDNGYTDFICGGAVGYDILAAAVVLIKKRENPDSTVRLHIFLPYNHGTHGKSDIEKKLYNMTLEGAYSVRHISEKYHFRCMQNRNEAMVDESSYCIAFCDKDHGGTVNTVRYALKHKKYVYFLPSGSQNSASFSRY